MQEKLTIRFQKLHALAQIPRQAHPTDAGFDLTATTKTHDENLYLVHYGTGIAVEIPQGYVGLVFPRSSVYKTGMTLTNAVGVIDSGYRGEIKAVFDSTFAGNEYEVGERIAQLVIVALPRVEFVAAAELSTSDRGANGYGSTGK